VSFITSKRTSSDAAEIERVLKIVLVLNLLVAGAKILYGTYANIVVIQADGLHSLMDAFGNVVGLVSMRFAHSPPDEEHPYGHARFEHLAAAVVGVLILIGLFEVGAGAWRALTGEQVAITEFGGLAVIVGTLGVNLVVTRYEARRARELRSTFLMADAKHTLSDVFVTLLVLVAWVGMRVGVVWADVAGAALVMGVVGRVGWSVLRENVPVLLDAAPIDPERIREVTVAIPGIVGCHRIRSRGSPRAAYLDLHIQVDPSMTVLDGHTLSHRVEEELMRRFPNVLDVLIHLEPDVPEERRP
jgi:cation diffusion facilitator family transporter